MSSDYTGYLYKFVDGAWVAKHPDLGRATNTIDVDLGSVLGDIYLTLTEEFPQIDDTSHDRTIGVTLTFEEFESLYLIAKEVYEKRKELKDSKNEHTRNI